MKLLHPEVEIVPGRPGQRPQVAPYTEGQPIPGSAIVRLINTSTQVNAWTVRLRCDEPLWQPQWYTLSALPPAPGTDNSATLGKPDQRGPLDKWVKIYVSRGGARDVLLRFDVPRSPEARAGKYHFQIEITTELATESEGRVVQLEGTAIIRPFYEWGLKVEPMLCGVGRLRRTAEFDLVVTNEGNDWLYCDLKLPRVEGLLVTSPTSRIAVPPPDPQEMLPAEGELDRRHGTERRLPARAASSLKAIRGEVVQQPFAVNARRIDAPSVAPPPNDANYVGMGVVVSSSTTEIKQAPGDHFVAYHPLIPVKLTLGSLKSLAYGALGAVIAFHVLVLGWEHIWHTNIEVFPTGTPRAGQPLELDGKWLRPSRITITGKVGDKEIVPVVLDTDAPTGPDPDAPKPDEGSSAFDKLKIEKPRNSRASIMLPKNLDGFEGEMKAQRVVPFLPWLTPLLPSSKAVPLQIGKLESGPVLARPSGQYAPNSLLAMNGTDLGPPGKVYLGGHPVTPKSWTSDEIDVTVPATATPGAFSVSVVGANGKPMFVPDDVSITIAPVTPTAPTGAAGGGAAVSGGVGTPGGNQASSGVGAAAGSGAGSAGGSGGKPTTSGKQAVTTAGAATGRPVIVRPARIPLGSTRQPGTAPYTLVNLEQDDAAMAAADQLIQQKNDPLALAVKAYELARTSSPGADQQAAAALAAAPERGAARAMALVAQSYVTAGQNPDRNALLQSLKQLTAATDADPTCAIAWARKLSLCLDNSLDTLADSTYQRAIKANPKPALLHFKFAEVYESHGRHTEAREELLAVRNADSRFFQSFYGRIVPFRTLADQLGVRA